MLSSVFGFDTKGELHNATKTNKGDFVNAYAWKHLADTLHEALVNDKWPLWGTEDKRFLALALAGEVGELANLIKKAWRGDEIENYQEKIKAEWADAQIYLYLLGKCFNLNADEACFEKMVKNCFRFGVTTPIVAELHATELHNATKNHDFVQSRFAICPGVGTSPHFYCETCEHCTHSDCSNFKSHAYV